MLDLAALARRDWETDVTGTVSYAVVGLGGYARGVSLPAIRDGDYGEVSVVVSGDDEKATETAAEYDAVGLDYEAYADGEASDSYDAVYIATPNRLHLPHVETAARHGAHVVCEKPLEATPERAREAVAVCRDAGVRLMTAYRMQTDPVVRWLRRVIQRGELGGIQTLSGDFVFPVTKGRDSDQWRLDPELAGGGALFDVGVYPLNTARFLLDADPVAVDATGGRKPVDTGGDREPADADDPFAGVDEHTHFRAIFPDAVGNFTASFSGYGSSTFEVVGERGRVRIDNAFRPGGDRRVTVDTADGRAGIEGAGRDETREEFDYFAHALLADAPIEPDGADGVADLDAMAAIYESADRGERVELAD